jgi:anti-sigma regulatory factor (Ser/Thr protein kinase)
MTQKIGLHVELASQWERVDTMREAVSHLIRVATDNEELGWALSMVGAELLENAIKYGSGSDVLFRLVQDADELRVEVTNNGAYESDHLRTLQTQVQWLNSFADPSEAYRKVLARVYEGADLSGSESGLGLARIRHEGECELACDCSLPGRVTVIARRGLPAKAKDLA